MKSSQEPNQWFNSIDQSILITKYFNGGISGKLYFYREWNKKFYHHEIIINSSVCDKKLTKDTIKELFIKKYNNKFFKNYEVIVITENRNKNKLLVMGKNLKCLECDSKKVYKNEMICDTTGKNTVYIINFWCQPCSVYRNQLKKIKE